MKKILLLIPSLFFAFASNAQLVYKDVAPVFYNRCASCHHTNGGAPFSLTGYSETVSNAAAISAALTDGIMPPWTPDTSYSRFLHERIITLQEKNDVLAWINNGTPAGDTTEAPPVPVFNQYALGGTPDLELSIPSFASNAGASDSYVCFSLPSGLTQDRILRAYEIVPGNVSIVHHVIVNVDTVGNTINDLSGGCYSAPGDFSIGGYAPGSAPTVFPGQAPLKMGIRIKAGSKIVLQMHYPAGSAGMIDSTKIRMYFYPVGAGGIRPVYVSTPLQNWNLYIPANQIKTFTAVYPSSGTLTYPISIFAAFPHSHKLATSLINYAYTSTDTIPLIRMNNWNFEWQGYYTYRNLVKVPNGYKLYSKHIFDNTTNNINNPNSPPQAVYAGTSTTDEMLFDSFQWMVYQAGDEQIDLAALLQNDPLLSSVTKTAKAPASLFKTYAFPNPFSQNVRIGYIIEKDCDVEVNVFTSQGTLIKSFTNKSQTAGIHELDWDGKTGAGNSLPGGSYYYVVKAGGKQSGGKLILMPER